MAKFSYVALDHRKKTVKGTVSAESAYAARKHLREKGIHATAIKETPANQEARSFKSIFRKNPKGQVIEFTRQLATMLNSGIKLTEALTVLTQQVSDVNLKNAIADICDRVVTGESFADTMTEYEQYFNIIYISMIRVGEVTGTLADALATIATFMEKRQRIESKLVTAMVYPLILTCACMAVVLFLTIKVIPVIANQIQRAGQELPLVTKFLVRTSDILTSWWLVVILATGFMFIYGIKRFLGTPKGRSLRDRSILAIPVFGPLIKQQITARFAGTLSTLLGAGLSMADSLRVVAEVTGNTVMNKAVRLARERILSGADIATPLRDSGVISPAIAHMVSVGEKSGELEQMLKSISKNLESSSDVVIDRLNAATEPVIIIIMAVIVGIIAYATLVPIIKYSAGTF